MDPSVTTSPQPLGASEPRSGEIALVTGATGFIGSAVARRLLAEGFELRALVRPGSDTRNLAGLDVEARPGALEDEASLARALAGCTALFHVAADYRLWVRDPAAMHRANVDGTVALMRAALAAGIRRIVYTSSVAALGLPSDGGSADETTPLDPASLIGPYKKSKWLAEQEVLRLVREAQLPAVIVNPSTPVGPRDRRPTPTGRMVLAAASGRIPAFLDTGLNLVHVDDVAIGHLLAFERGAVGERYVLGGENMALSEMLRIVAEIVGRPPPRIALPYWSVLPAALAGELWGRLTGKEPLVSLDSWRMARKHMFFASDKARQFLGYAPRPARQGLEDAVVWFRREGCLR